jgi:CheY-like chemotaxis protein
MAALLEAARLRRPFPLVLLDDGLPDEDGFSLAARIQAEPALAGKFLMMLTSGDGRGEQARCEAMKLGGWLMKPIKQSDLFDAIVTALGHPVMTQHSTDKRWLEPAPPHLRRKILLAEDNLINQRVAVGLLTRRGHECAVALNGRIALEELARQPFDILLMDVQMPELDGLATAAEIRRQERKTGRHLPIVALTANAMKGDREHCLAAGYDNYLDKPIRPEKLFAMIESLPLDGPPLLSVPQPERPPVSARAAEPAVAERARSVETSPLSVSACCVDWSLALADVQGDEALLGEIVNIFLEEHQEMLQQVRLGISTGDAAKVRASAHTLKGALLHFGAEAAVDAAKRLESMGRSLTLDGAPAICEALERELSQLQAELVAFNDRVKA